MLLSCRDAAIQSIIYIGIAVLVIDAQIYSDMLFHLAHTVFTLMMAVFTFQTWMVKTIT
jgi:hypothetical protein